MDKTEHVIGADILRIFAGFGVILIHVVDPFLVYPPYLGVKGASWEILNIINYFFRFSVPLFVMLSGYLLLRPKKYTDFKKLYQRRFVRVGIPFIIWLAVHFIITHFKGVEVNLWYVIESIMTVNLDHLYFIVVILELYFITPLFLVFLKYTNKKTHTILVLSTFIFTAFLAIINFIIPKAQIYTNHNLLTIFLPFTAYYLAGYQFAKEKVKGFDNIILAVLFTSFALFGAFISNGLTDSYPRYIGSINVIVMTLIVFVLFINNEFIKNLGKNKFAAGIIKYLASCIFGIYLIHMLTIFLLDKFTSLTVESIGSPMWLYVFIKTAAVFLISFIVVAVVKKLPFGKYIFG